MSHFELALFAPGLGSFEKNKKASPLMSYGVRDGEQGEQVADDADAHVAQLNNSRYI